MTVDAGSDEKESIAMESGQASYPVTTWSKSGGYKNVVIEYSQECLGLSSCQLADVSFSELPPSVNFVDKAGEVILTGDYDGINEAMQNLIIAPGLGNTSPINVKVTATDPSGVASDFDSFVIPIDSVSSVLSSV